MVVLIALTLTLVSVFLQPAQKKNIDLEKKKNILNALKINIENQDGGVIFDKYIVDKFAVTTEGEKIENINVFEINLKEQLKLPPKDQRWPVYVAKLDNGEIKYIFSLYGTGLWGPIWGYVALNDDMETVYGAYFDHKSETPGLGGDIALPAFQQKFNGKRIFNDKGEFVSIDVRKGGISNDIYAVDAISGGTITSTGVKNMLKTCLSAYVNFIKANKK